MRMKSMNASIQLNGAKWGAQKVAAIAAEEIEVDKNLRRRKRITYTSKPVQQTLHCKWDNNKDGAHGGQSPCGCIFQRPLSTIAVISHKLSSRQNSKSNFFLPISLLPKLTNKKALLLWMILLYRFSCKKRIQYGLIRALEPPSKESTTVHSLMHLQTHPPFFLQGDATSSSTMLPSLIESPLNFQCTYYTCTTGMILQNWLCYFCVLVLVRVAESSRNQALQIKTFLQHHIQEVHQTHDEGYAGTWK